jgi:hypothetical protein|uniref:Uncharacterized protein n=1 Tax=Myoviridae sp. ctqfO1 TaxID=2827710 RepID=A0A8S5T2H2_9CAUD|nr:MAG TPA: hypothetical protein [Myoviridae sp. ctqfO1]
MSTYTLPVEMFEAFTKKAEKYGDNIVINVVSKSLYEGKFPIVTFTVEGDKPLVGGYEVLAVKQIKLNHVTINGGGVDEVPKEYWEHTSHCDHCGKERNRKKFLILKNISTGEIVQIGMACVKDYLNNVETDLNKMMKWMDEVDEVSRYDYQDFIPMLGKNYYDVKNFLTIAHSVIKEKGYISTSDAAEYKKDSTKTECARIYWKEASKYENNKEIVEDMIAWWISKNDEDNAFWNNVTSILKDGYASDKELGYIAFIPSAYAKHLANSISYTDKFANINIGDKVEVSVTLKRKTAFATQYGTSVFYQFADANGICYVWKTTPREALEELDAETEITLKGTVKEFREYNGTKQTVLTRCKV